MFPNGWVDDNVINKLESVKHLEGGKKKKKTRKWSRQYTEINFIT